jgi:hypothetical protein
MTAYSPIRTQESEAGSLLRPLTGGGLAWPVAGIVVVLALQCTMIFTHAINWDEFYHYSLVELFTRGIVTQPFQTLFVRLFFWLPPLPGSGVAHILVARIVMFGCEIVAAAATASLAARFTNRTAGTLAALCYLSAGFVLQHGFSFRADPVAAALLMCMLWILGCSSFRGGWVFAFGALGAIAELYTIKCVLYAPAFVALGYWRWSEADDRRGTARALAAACCIAGALFALLLYLHSQAVSNAAQSAESLLHASAEKMPSLGSPMYRSLILEAAFTAPVFALLVVAFPVALRSAAISRGRKVALAGLWSEILVLGVYHNTAPYFYVFILPPVAVACALPLAAALSRISPKIIVTASAAMAFVMWTGEDGAIIARQRALVQAADKIFPTRVTYFDFCAMLGRDNKANAFMTPWGGELYRQGYMPSMRETMQKEAVPLVVEDDPMFTRVLRGRGPSPDFLPEDAAALRSTYLHFWGPFWVAGAVIPATAHDQETEFLVPGSYTLTGGAIALDGKMVRPDQVVPIARGMHLLTASDRKAARLTWGDHLAKPAEPSPPADFWTRF